jgi:Shikimate kinase
MVPKNEKIYEDSIILIGPSGAGKSTVAKELASRTSMPRLCLDSIANAMLENKDLMKKFSNSDEFYEYLIEFTLEQVQVPGICDFGAGHSVFDNYENYSRVKEKLAPFQNIILLLPSNDIKHSLDILNERTTSNVGKTENLKILQNPCNENLATIVFYTNNKGPNQISEEILKLIDEKREVKNI